jgi:hypothetical protein
MPPGTRLPLLSALGNTMTFNEEYTPILFKHLDCHIRTHFSAQSTAGALYFRPEKDSWSVSVIVYLITQSNQLFRARNGTESTALTFQFINIYFRHISCSLWLMIGV